MSGALQLVLNESDIYARIEALNDVSLDELEFGVIGFDGETVVRRYNSFESKCAGLSASHVVGQRLFTVIAPCMNNYLVAQRFEDAAANGTALDTMIDYVLTFRMRPLKVKLRLLAPADQGLRYILVSPR
jgi:photoactive yellow protein